MTLHIIANKTIIHCDSCGTNLDLAVPYIYDSIVTRRAASLCGWNVASSRYTYDQDICFQCVTKPGAQAPA